MLALAVSYEIQCRFTAAVPVMAKGFNHATQLAISVAASAGKLFGLSASQIANAISIATADNVSLACIHVEPVSQWKGFSPGWTGMRAVYAVSMAKRGFTGPVGLFEGPWGLEFMFGQPIPVNWEDPSLEIVKQTVLKKYCSLIHGQPVIEAALDVKRSNSLTATDVEHVRCDTFQAGYDFAGGGTYGSKDHPWMKEQGDYNLKYLISAALLDDQVGGAARRSGRTRATDHRAGSGGGCAGDGGASRGPSRRAVHGSLSSRALRPHHRSNEGWAGIGEGASRLRGRFRQPDVVGPDRREVPLAERSVR